MTRRATRRGARTTHDRRQLSLLDQVGAPPLVEVPESHPVPAGSCDDDQRVRRGLNQIIKSSGKSREDIAVAMSRWAGTTITVPMLNTWTAPSRANNFPMRYLRALILACAADASALLDPVLDGTGYRAIDQDVAALARLGQVAALMAWGQREAARLSAGLPVASSASRRR